MCAHHCCGASSVSQNITWQHFITILSKTQLRAELFKKENSCYVCMAFIPQGFSRLSTGLNQQCLWMENYTFLISNSFPLLRHGFSVCLSSWRNTPTQRICYKQKKHTKHTFLPLNYQPTKNNKLFLQWTNLHLFCQEVLQSWRPCLLMKIKKRGWVKASMQNSGTEWREKKRGERIQIAPGLESTYDAVGKLNWINFARKWITSNLRQQKQTDRKQD